MLLFANQIIAALALIASFVRSSQCLQGFTQGFLRNGKGSTWNFDSLISGSDKMIFLSFLTILLLPRWLATLCC